MTFEQLVEIGVRQQKKAQYKNWAFEQYHKTCDICCKDNRIKMTCNCCDECPVTLAYEEACKRIAETKENPQKLEERRIDTDIRFSVNPDKEYNIDKTVGDVRDLDEFLSHGIRVRLETAGISSISELRNMSDNDLKKIPRIGAGAIEKIRSAIANHCGNSDDDNNGEQKNERNRTITYTFEKKYYTAEEWGIIKLLMKKGGKKQ